MKKKKKDLKQKIEKKEFQWSKEIGDRFLEFSSWDGDFVDFLFIYQLLSGQISNKFLDFVEQKDIFKKRFDGATNFDSFSCYILSKEEVSFSSIKRTINLFDKKIDLVKNFEVLENYLKFSKYSPKALTESIEDGNRKNKLEELLSNSKKVNKDKDNSFNLLSEDCESLNLIADLFEKGLDFFPLDEIRLRVKEVVDFKNKKIKETVKIKEAVNKNKSNVEITFVLNSVEFLLKVLSIIDTDKIGQIFNEELKSSLNLEDFIYLSSINYKDTEALLKATQICEEIIEKKKAYDFKYNPLQDISCDDMLNEKFLQSMSSLYDKAYKDCFFNGDLRKSAEYLTKKAIVLWKMDSMGSDLNKNQIINHLFGSLNFNLTQEELDVGFFSILKKYTNEEEGLHELTKAYLNNEITQNLIDKYQASKDPIINYILEELGKIYEFNQFFQVVRGKSFDNFSDKEKELFEKYQTTEITSVIEDSCEETFAGFCSLKYALLAKLTCIALTDFQFNGRTMVDCYGLLSRGDELKRWDTRTIKELIILANVKTLETLFKLKKDSQKSDRLFQDFLTSIEKFDKDFNDGSLSYLLEQFKDKEENPQNKKEEVLSESELKEPSVEEDCRIGKKEILNAINYEITKKQEENLTLAGIKGEKYELGKNLYYNPYEEIYVIFSAEKYLMKVKNIENLIIGGNMSSLGNGCYKLYVSGSDQRFYNSKIYSVSVEGKEIFVIDFDSVAHKHEDFDKRVKAKCESIKGYFTEETLNKKEEPVNKEVDINYIDSYPGASEFYKAYNLTGDNKDPDEESKI